MTFLAAVGFAAVLVGLSAAISVRRWQRRLAAWFEGGG